MKSCLFLLFPMLFLPSWGSVSGEAVLQKEKSLFRPGKDFALFFANKTYTGTGWNDLKNPIRDAEAIAKELREMYGFSTVEVYRDKAKAEIERILEQWQRKRFPGDSQLFVFFSGHGTFRDFSGQGYFVPRNGRKGNYDSLIELATLGNIVSNIPCPHILLAVDACYSGAIDREIVSKGPTMSRPYDTPETERNNIIYRQLRNRSRLFLTSGGKERTFDGINHSPFAEAILSSLRYAYTSGDGLATYADLEARLERVSPTPHHGRLANDEDGGFVFVVERRPSDLKYITDGDGNTYPIVHLAGKQWLGKNLNLEVPGSYCYDDDPANCREYGRLYTWEAAKEACRKLGVGWHLPTDQEWKDLLITFGGYYEWYEQEEVGDSEKSYSVLIKDGSSSFAALLGGGRNVDGEYLHLGKYGTYWSASELDASLAWVYGLHGDDERVDRPVSIKSMALSCRCLKNNFSPKDKR